MDVTILIASILAVAWVYFTVKSNKDKKDPHLPF
jgi:hypothetical protein